MERDRDLQARRNRLREEIRAAREVERELSDALADAVARGQDADLLSIRRSDVRRRLDDLHTALAHLDAILDAYTAREIARLPRHLPDIEVLV